MKKLVILLVLVLFISAVSIPVFAEESSYQQSPMLDALVEIGELPPVEERLPENPTVADEYLEEYAGSIGIGKYGGNLRTVTTSTGMVGDMLVAITENLCIMQSCNSGVILPNLVDDYQVSEDYTVHTFTIKKNLKWSDGTEVTMEDYAFGLNDVQFNTAINPITPSWLSNKDEPGRFEIVDEYTFTITFAGPYGGFATHLSCNGWKSYDSFCLPSAWMKRFHKDYAEECHGSVDGYYEFIEPFAEILGVDNFAEDDNWGLVFSGVKLDIWAATDPTKAMQTNRFAGLLENNSPVLYPWVMKSSKNGVTVWERNPYYFKVDADGNQLPYIDTITVFYVESPEIIQLKAISGDVDFLREAATLSNINLYRENEEAANITSYIMSMTKNPPDININITYGLNTDGSIKEDEASQAWQEVMQTDELRRALMYAIDADELAEAIYYGFAEKNPAYECTGDIDKANKILDGMGMIDIDSDGWRETPSGLPFNVQLWFTTETDPAWAAISELYCNYWNACGLRITGNNTQSSLYSTSTAANEVPMALKWNNNTMLWFYNNWQTGDWATLYNVWYDKGGLTADLGESYLAPTGDVLEFFELMDTVTKVTPDVAVSVNNVRMMEIVSEHCYIIEPLYNIAQPVVFNSSVRNIPTGGVANSVNYSLELCYFDDAD